MEFIEPKILISIKPEWVKKILSGEKTIEVRKTKPKIGTPFKCYIYQTKEPVEVTFSGCGRHISEYDKYMWYTEQSGKVVGEFICGCIEPIYVFGDCSIQNWMMSNAENSCLTYDEVVRYIGKEKNGYCWHISSLTIYDTPKDLSEFGIKRAPQSWQYVERKSV